MLTYIRYVDVNFTFALVDRPFRGWSGHLWKERLNFSKIAKFESDTSQVCEDMAPPCKVPKIYRRLYCGGGGATFGPPPPHHTNVCKSLDFEELYLC